MSMILSQAKMLEALSDGFEHAATVVEDQQQDSAVSLQDIILLRGCAAAARFGANALRERAVKEAG